ncbi:helix-turn-helix domain-containing protein [Variovorax rhizosphaerae]|uniref:Helix-turn-helix domain-containing protein n=2 Tax=Variovorax rhizosphaerae TaxID=1836200 RepID=A0ABU8WH67_9BURK
MPVATTPPLQLFASTRVQRVASARRQFFEEGVRPSGLVGEAVLQSWMRCRRGHTDTQRPVKIAPVTSSRLHAAMGRNRQLLDVARPELSAMEGALGGTDCRVILTDPSGVVLHVTRHHAGVHQPVLGHARVDVNVCETVVGTSAPGIVVATGQACAVSGGEHYFDALGQMQCAAAPVRDVHGQLAGVLDLTTEGRPFAFDAASLVALHATTIENQLLQAQSRDHLVLCFQASPALLGTPLEALAGISGAGTVAWLNDAARRLTSGLQGDERELESLFGLDLASLLRLARQSTAQPVRLGNGLGVWMQARLTAADGIDFRHAVVLPDETPDLVVAECTGTLASALLPQVQQPVDEPAHSDKWKPGTLLDHNRKLIEETVAACGGNLSEAARKLGVSRGTLYRRLRASQQPETTSQ